MYNQMDKIRNDVETGAHDASIVRVTEALQNKTAIPDGVSKESVEAAKVWFGIKNKIFSDLKAVSPTLKYRQDFFFPQTHDLEKIRLVDEDTWVATMQKTHGKKSFPDLLPEQKEAAFREVYQNMYEYKHGTGTAGNARSRVAMGRKLIPNDAEGFLEYHQQFGEGTLAQVMQSYMHQSARNVAQIEKFGSNHEVWLKTVMKRMSKTMDKKQSDKFMKKQPDFLARISRTRGDLSNKAEGVYALTDGLRQIEGMALSGGTVVSSMPDAVIAAGLISDTTGKNIAQVGFELMGKFAASFVDKTGSKNHLLRAGIFIDTFHKMLANDAGPGIAPQGVAAQAKSLAGKGFNLARKYYGRITLIDRYLAAAKSSIVSVVQNYWSELLQKPWTSMNKELQEGFLRYGIDSKAHVMLMHALEEQSSFMGKKKFLSLAGIDAIPDEAMDVYLEATGKWKSDLKIPESFRHRARQELKLRVGALLNDHADIGTSTAGAKQKYFMLGNSDSNSGMGQVRQLFWQFKGASLVSFDAIRRRAATKSSIGGKAAAVGTSVAGLYLMGSMSQWVYDAWQGKTPADPRDPKFILKSFARSAAGSVWGSLLADAMQANGVFSTEARLLQGLAGPVVGTLAEGTAIGIAAGKEALSDKYIKKYPTKQAGKLLMRSLPYQNVFWAQGAANAIVLNTIREEMDSGFAGSIAKRLRDTPGLFTDSGHQEYFMFDPTGGR